MTRMKSYLIDFRKCYVLISVTFNARSNKNKLSNTPLRHVVILVKFLKISGFQIISF